MSTRSGRLLMDVDTGVDDALALALAVRHPEVQLEAVITVAGNVGLDLTTRNTLRVLDWLGAADVPVAVGAGRPLTGPIRADREALADQTSREAILVREVTRQLFDIRRLDAMALHDPLAVCVAIQPDLVTTIQRSVEVETQGKHTLGQTVVDLRSDAQPGAQPTRVAIDVDVARARDVFFETLGFRR